MGEVKPGPVRSAGSCRQGMALLGRARPEVSLLAIELRVRE